MTSGGARGRSGPAPDPNALRRDRPGDGDWVTLPDKRTGPAPMWPLAIPPSPSEELHWAREWTRPQAVEWERCGQEVEVALYVRCLAEAEMPGAANGLRGEVRQRSEHLGLSLPGLARNRWRMAPSTTTPAKPSAGRAKPARSSSRDRLTVVPAVEDDPAPF